MLLKLRSVAYFWQSIGLLIRGWWVRIPSFRLVTFVVYFKTCGLEVAVLARRRADTEAILKNANLVPSQSGASFYDKLSRDGRWDRFVAVVQSCSMRGLTIDETVVAVNKFFPGYFRKMAFDVQSFKKLLSDFPELSQAWGYGVLGDDVTDIQVKNHALKLVMSSDNIDDVKTFTDIYGTQLQKNKAVEKTDDDDKKTTFNFNLTSG